MLFYCISIANFIIYISDGARKLTKISLRKPFVEDLISYEKQEVEEIVKFVYQEEVQNTIEAYMKGLKESKK